MDSVGMAAKGGIIGALRGTKEVGVQATDGLGKGPKEG
jgi:hypothetical protein